MSEYRILVVNNEGAMYEDYIKVSDVDFSVGDYGIAIAKKIEELYGTGADKRLFPQMFIMDGTYDNVAKTEIGHYKLEPNEKGGEYQYLFFKRVISREVALLENLIPTIVSLDETDIANIKRQLF